MYGLRCLLILRAGVLAALGVRLCRRRCRVRLAVLAIIRCLMGVHDVEALPSKIMNDNDLDFIMT